MEQVWLDALYEQVMEQQGRIRQKQYANQVLEILLSYKQGNPPTTP